MCDDPSSLTSLTWWLCYLSTTKHVLFYLSFGTVIITVLVVGPLALAVGLAAALAKRARIAPLRWLATGYTSIVRGVPDVIFFLFGIIAMDQALEWIRHRMYCPDWEEPVRRGSDFVVCDAAKLPLSTAPEYMHDLYGWTLAIVSFAFVFGAFAGNVIDGAMKAVPRGQIEAAQAIGMRPYQILTRVHLPQMWRYALPGLSNLWQILIKATPVLFVLGIEDAVFWARELGGLKTKHFDYPHPDWRIYYFGVLLVFYISFTYVSQIVFGRLEARFARGQASAGAL